MGLIEALVLGLAQGLTEFLPISSSAHLRIIPDLFGWDDAGASFTAVLQLGTTAAVLIAFRAELTAVTVAGWAGVRDKSKRASTDWQLARHIVLGSIPIVVVGAAAAGFIEGPLRNRLVVAAALVVGTGWLYWATRTEGARTVREATDRDAWLVGAAQVGAVVPGMSRSGMTIGAGYLLGLAPTEAARFSFLLSIPAIVASGIYGLKDIGSDLQLAPTALAVGVAFVVGWATISWLLRLVSTGRFTGFLVYRVGLAVLVVCLVAR